MRGVILFMASKINQFKNQGGRILSALMALCLFMASCEKDGGIVPSVVSLEGDQFSPRAAAFFATVTDVLDACGLSEDAAVYNGQGQCRIVREIRVDTLTATETFSSA